MSSQSNLKGCKQYALSTTQTIMVNHCACLMIYCLNVKHVMLPAYMDTSNSDDLWTYFLTTIKSANTWKLHSLSVDWASHIIENDDARRHYYECLYHFQGGIRTFTMTANMISGSYDRLQGFQ